VREFFEDLPDIIEGFSSSFFCDIKTILEKIDPPEKINSIGTSMKVLRGDLKDYASGAHDKVKDTAGGLSDTDGNAIGLFSGTNKTH
jgi:hypothetical protein